MGDETLYPKSEVSHKDLNLQHQEKKILDHWEESFKVSPIQRLKYLDALLARTTDTERTESIKWRVAELLREVDAGQVLGEPQLVTMVRYLFGEKGLKRLREKVKSQHSDVVEDMAHPVHQRGKV
jgi:hypothetical protein